MTANQISYAANQEQVRHDQVTEELSAEANQISRERNQIDAQYKMEMNQISREYNEKSLALQEAQGDRKLDLQEELNWLEWKKADIDQRYKHEMSLVAQKDSKTRENAQIESERYQKELNRLGFSEQAIKAQLANLEERQIEYQKQYNDNLVRIQDFNALINKQKTDNEYSLGLIRSELQQTELELRSELQEYQKATMFTNSVWEGISSIFGLVKGARR